MTSTAPASSPAKIELEYVCSYWATLSPPEVIGPVAEGIRVNFYVTADRSPGRKCEVAFGPSVAIGS
jgi:hypothetical protein